MGLSAVCLVVDLVGEVVTEGVQGVEGGREEGGGGKREVEGGGEGGGGRREGGSG